MTGIPEFSQFPGDDWISKKHEAFLEHDIKTLQFCISETLFKLRFSQLGSV